MFLLKNSLGIDFTTENMTESLKFLGVGMLSIFAVIGVIIVVTVVLNKIFSQKK